MFRHHPDHLIYINNLQIPLSFFKQLEPSYSLPDGIISREYLPGKYHRLFDQDGQWGAGTVWEEGDKYLAKLDEYKAAWMIYQKSIQPTIIQQPILPNPKKIALDKVKVATTILQLKTVLIEYFES
jgi:hypothetical protein